MPYERVRKLELYNRTPERYPQCFITRRMCARNRHAVYELRFYDLSSTCMLVFIVERNSLRKLPGAFGLVYKGSLLDRKLQNPKDVAIKTIQGKILRLLPTYFPHIILFIIILFYFYFEVSNAVRI